MRVLLRGLVPLAISAFVLLALPGLALAASGSNINQSNVAIDTIWVLLCALLVFFMLAGFAALEVGLVRSKNAGSIIAKVIFNAAIAAIAFASFGFAIGFGKGGDVFGSDFGSVFGTVGFFLSGFNNPINNFPAMGASDAIIQSKFLFQYGFAAVVLAIAVGPLVERVKFSTYIIFGFIFCGFIYPLAAHEVYGGGFLQKWGMEDFAGSTAVHLVGAAAGLAGVLLLGPRRGKYVRGISRPLPGHSMPMFGLGVLILWFGWFGFNAGSTFNALDGRFAEVALVTHMSVVGGILGATIVNWIHERNFDIAMIGNGAIAGAVAITSPSGYVQPWAAVPIGMIGGFIVVEGLRWIDGKLDDPIGAITAHGMVGIWGTLAAGLFAVPALAAHNAVGVKVDGEFIGGLFYSGSFRQIGIQLLGLTIVALFTFATSYAVFAALKATIGIRVDV
ncbi:MAG: ammonium transporter, partial [Thermoleophilaceae bacterium]|nr:ammonium transporter [Thermoleophilaceae bacterium]